MKQQPTGLWNETFWQMHKFLLGNTLTAKLLWLNTSPYSQLAFLGMELVCFPLYIDNSNYYTPRCEMKGPHKYPVGLDVQRFLWPVC